MTAVHHVQYTAMRPPLAPLCHGWSFLSTPYLDCTPYLEGLESCLPKCSAAATCPHTISTLQACLPACLRFTHMCTALCSHVHGRVALPRLHIHTACLAVCLPACASRTHMYEVRCSHVHGQVSLPRLLLLVLVRAWQHLLDARGQAGLGLVAGA